MEIDIAWLEEKIFHRKLDEKERKLLSESIQRLEFAKGDVVMNEGERSDGLYLLYSGRAGVFHDSHGESVRVGEVDSGAQLGDMAIFDDEPYSATITARNDCAIYKIPRQKLDALMGHQHDLAHDIMLNTIRRLSSIVRGMNTVNAYSQQYIRGRRV